MSIHKTVDIVIKRAEVDEEIVPLVEWLNSFKGVVTLYCCQGHTKEEVCEDGRFPYSTYVLFTCSNQWSLMQILEKMTNFDRISRTHDFVRCEVSFDPEVNHSVRYLMSFVYQEVMQSFTNYIKTGKINAKRISKISAKNGRTRS